MILKFGLIEKFAYKANWFHNFKFESEVKPESKSKSKAKIKFEPEFKPKSKFKFEFELINICVSNKFKNLKSILQSIALKDFFF